MSFSSGSLAQEMARRQRRNQHQDATLLQKQRNITHSQLYFYLMQVPFSSPGVIGEQTPAFSKDVGFDGLIMGAWTDLTAATLQLQASSSGWQYSNEFIPVRSMFGNSTQVNPVLWWEDPVLLTAHSTLKASWKNNGGESGTFNAVFYAKKTDQYDHAGNLITPGDQDITVKLTQPFRLFMDLSVPKPVTSIIDNDILIYGATCNLETSTFLIRVINESNSWAWSSDQIPIRSIAGVDGSVQPILRFDRPYLLPANVRLRADTSAQVTGAYIAFTCRRILA